MWWKRRNKETSGGGFIRPRKSTNQPAESGIAAQQQGALAKEREEYGIKVNMHTRCVLYCTYSHAYTHSTAVNCVRFSYRFKWAKNVASASTRHIYPGSRISSSLCLYLVVVVYTTMPAEYYGGDDGGRSRTHIAQTSCF